MTIPPKPAIIPSTIKLFKAPAGSISETNTERFAIP